MRPDFDYLKNNSDSDVEFAHRKLKNGDIYFLDKRSNHDESIDASFRVVGMRAELWRAETGTAAPASFRIADGRTTVPLHLEPWGAVFVVFRKATSEISHAVSDPMNVKVATINGLGTLLFSPAGELLHRSP